MVVSCASLLGFLSTDKWGGFEILENHNALQFFNPNSQSPLSLLSKNGLQITQRITMRYVGNGQRKHRVQEEMKKELTQTYKIKKNILIKNASIPTDAQPHGFLYR
ncbi:hypothetical protein V6Z12_D12G179300 [Gossypium hirsutum]